MKPFSFEAQLLILQVLLALVSALITLLLKEWFDRSREKRKLQEALEKASTTAQGRANLG